MLVLVVFRPVSERALRGGLLVLEIGTGLCYYLSYDWGYATTGRTESYMLKPDLV